jgi:hypothetical protein
MLHLIILINLLLTIIKIENNMPDSTNINTVKKVCDSISIDLEYISHKYEKIDSLLNTIK